MLRRSRPTSNIRRLTDNRLRAVRIRHMKQQASDLLARLVREAPRGTVDLDWLLNHVKKRAFGLLLLILAIAILVPALGIIARASGIWPLPLVSVLRDCHDSTPGDSLSSASRFVRHRYLVAPGIRIPGLDFGQRPRKSPWCVPPVLGEALNCDLSKISNLENRRHSELMCPAGVCIVKPRRVHADVPRKSKDT
jgi:hypothetical protein